MTPLVITGTGTEVGKTIVTAAIAALARDAGQRVAVVKPAQTGIGSGEESDVDVVTRLSGVGDVHELVRYPDPLAPATAARRAGVEALSVKAMLDHVRALEDRDLVLVEGAGGLLVRLDDDGNTVADIAAGLEAQVLVVSAAGLGSLNAIALTTESIALRGLICRGVVFGCWPATPDLAATENMRDAPAYAGASLLGALPAGAGGLNASAFLHMARNSLAPELGGNWRGSAQ